jgi:hypothetical protein
LCLRREEGAEDEVVSIVGHGGYKCSWAQVEICSNAGISAAPRSESA